MISFAFEVPSSALRGEHFFNITQFGLPWEERVRNSFLSEHFPIRQKTSSKENYRLHRTPVELLYGETRFNERDS